MLGRPLTPLQNKECNCVCPCEGPRCRWGRGALGARGMPARMRFTDSPGLPTQSPSGGRNRLAEQAGSSPGGSRANLRETTVKYTRASFLFLKERCKWKKIIMLWKVSNKKKTVSTKHSFCNAVLKACCLTSSATGHRSNHRLKTANAARECTGGHNSHTATDRLHLLRLPHFVGTWFSKLKQVTQEKVQLMDEKNGVSRTDCFNNWKLFPN